MAKNYSMECVNLPEVKKIITQSIQHKKINILNIMFKV